MEKKSTVVGMQMMAITEGTELGVVSSLIIDAAAKRVTHLVLGNEKGMLGYNMAAPVEKIVGVGRDFLTVLTSADLVQVWKVGEGLGHCMLDGELVGLTVISSAGNIEGKISDFAFDIPGSGSIEEYSVEEGPKFNRESAITIAPRGIFVNFKNESVEQAPAQTHVQPQVQAQPALENAPEEAAAEEEAVEEEAIDEATLNEPPTSVSDDEDLSLNDEEDYFARRQSDFLLGRIVSKDILDEDGTVLINSGTTITASVFKRAKKANKLTELSLNAFNQTLIRR
ncbi:MAG TPA: PRC-barrel domain-containing protein [Clostridia bacterium]|nr:PRC-barrel domain-containing protein [Clostridia bacterium]